MKKLNKKKIKWIVKEIERRDKGVYSIARIQDITKQHAYRVHKKHKGFKDPVLKRSGRKLVHDHWQDEIGNSEQHSGRWDLFSTKRLYTLDRFIREENGPITIADRIVEVTGYSVP